MRTMNGTSDEMAEAAEVRRAAPLCTGHWRVWMVFLCALFAVVFTRTLAAHGDDMQYALAARAAPLLPLLQQRYQDWSGRLVIDAAMFGLLNHIVLWRLGTAAAIVFVLGRYLRLLGHGRDALAAAFVLQAFFLVQHQVLYWGAWWVTGSFNYLWAFATGLAALTPFLEPGLRNRWFWLWMPCAAYAAGQEQAGLLLIGLQALLGWSLWRRGRLRWPHAVQWALSVLVLGANLLAPGSASRYTASIGFFPEYADWSLPQRAFAGLDLAFAHFFAPGNQLALLLAMLLCLRVWQVSASRWNRTLAVVPLAVFAVPWLGGFLFATTRLQIFFDRVWAYQREDFDPGLRSARHRRLAGHAGSGFLRALFRGGERMPLRRRQSLECRFAVSQRAARLRAAGAIHRVRPERTDRLFTQPVRVRRAGAFFPGCDRAVAGGAAVPASAWCCAAAVHRVDDVSFRLARIRVRAQALTALKKIAFDQAGELRAPAVATPSARQR